MTLAPAFSRSETQSATCSKVLTLRPRVLVVCVEETSGDFGRNPQSSSTYGGRALCDAFKHCLPYNGGLVIHCKPLRSIQGGNISLMLYQICTRYSKLRYTSSARSWDFSNELRWQLGRGLRRWRCLPSDWSLRTRHRTKLPVRQSTAACRDPALSGIQQPPHPQVCVRRMGGLWNKSASPQEDETGGSAATGELSWSAIQNDHTVDDLLDTATLAHVTITLCSKFCILRLPGAARCCEQGWQRRERIPRIE